MSGLTRMSKATYSTRRNPDVDVNQKVGASVVYLTGVKCVPVMSPGGERDNRSLPINQPIPGQVDKTWETFIEYQTHLKSGVSVTELPDIKENDIMVIDGANWGVRVVRTWTETTVLLQYIHVTLEQPT